MANKKTAEELIKEILTQYSAQDLADLIQLVFPKGNANPSQLDVMRGLATRMDIIAKVSPYINTQIEDQLLFQDGLEELIRSGRLVQMFSEYKPEFIPNVFESSELSSVRTHLNGVLDSARNTNSAFNAQDFFKNFNLRFVSEARQYIEDAVKNGQTVEQIIYTVSQELERQELSEEKKSTLYTVYNLLKAAPLWFQIMIGSGAGVSLMDKVYSEGFERVLGEWYSLSAYGLAQSKRLAVVVTDGGTHARGIPVMESAIVCTIPKHTKVAMTGKEANGMAEVHLPSGKDDVGWIPLSSITVLPEEKSPKPTDNDFSPDVPITLGVVQTPSVSIREQSVREVNVNTPGLYSVTYITPMGVGQGCAFLLENGTIYGGDNIMAFHGTWSESPSNKAVLTAEVTCTTHGHGPQFVKDGQSLKFHVTEVERPKWKGSLISEGTSIQLEVTLEKKRDI